MNPGIGESPQSQFRTGPAALSCSARFIWQQLEVFATTGRLLHPQDDFPAWGPQQQPPGPEAFKSFPQHPRSRG